MTARDSGSTNEFDAFLECGVLAHGFLRLRCGDCGHDKRVAFSCKRRGFCPSCGAWHMAQTAAHLVGDVIPHVPVRQWVLSLPIPLRLLLAAQPHLVTPVLQVVHRVIMRQRLGQAGVKADEADSGAVTLIQRFGSAANLNIHLHCLVLDGMYRRGAEGTPKFVEAAAPTDEALPAVLRKIITRTMQLLTRQALEQRCRCITRPALADERVQTHAAGEVVLTLKTPWRDGTTHLLMSPPEFMQRLAPLVPRPRLHLIRLHGVLASSAKLRAQVVPQEPALPAQAPPSAECEANRAHHRPVRLSGAKLLKRVFEIDLEHCPSCGGELKIIAAVLEQPVIKKILTHLELQARAPPRSPASGQVLQAARRELTATVQATRRHGPLESAASEVLPDPWKWDSDQG